MRQCPTCAAETAQADARFCGNCGALLPEAALTGPAPAGGGPDEEGRLSSPRQRLLVGAIVVALVVGGVVAQAVRGGDPLPVGRADPTPPPTTPAADVRWERDDVLQVGRDATVRAAGDQHVLVGGRVVATSPRGTAGVRALPPAIGAIGDEGTWAVAERGTLTLGTVGGGAAATASGVGGLDGDVVTWRGGLPVLRGGDGVLRQVERDGEVVWRTDRPVLADGPRAQRWLSGSTDQGTPVVVATDNGTVVDVAGQVLAIRDDVAVLADGGEVAAVDLAAGGELWRQEAPLGEWEVVGEDLVVVRSGSAERVDPATGETLDRLDGFAPVPVRRGVVVQGNGELVATAWDGRELWQVDLEATATHAVRSVDADRVAVVTGGELVTVLAAEDGRELARVTAPPQPAPATGVIFLDRTAEGLRAGLVGIATGIDDTPTWIEAATGEAADGPDELPPRGGSIDTEAGPVELDVGLVSVAGDGGGAWTATFEVPLATRPVGTTARLVVTLVDGTVVALDPARGTELWRTQLTTLPTALAATGQEVLVGTDDGRLVRLDTLGSELASSRLGEPVVAVVRAEDVVVTVGPSTVSGLDLRP